MTGIVFVLFFLRATYVPVFRKAVSCQLMRSHLDLDYLNSSLFSLVLKLLHPLSREYFLQKNRVNDCAQSVCVPSQTKLSVTEIS